MFILHVTYEVKEGMREAFLARLSELQVGEKSRAEEGNIDYSYYLPADGSNRVFLAEIWESRAAQEKHIGSDHVKALAAVKSEYVANTVLLKYDGAEPV